MTGQTLLLGIDVGTSGVKALLIDAAGRVVAETINEFPLFTPRPLWAEQNPQDWWDAAVVSIRQAMKKGRAKPEQVAGIGLTGQMHGLVILDGKGKVLRPCILWNDQRTASQCAAITARLGSQRILELTGNPVLPGFTAPKILWVREREPEVLGKASKILLPKDYLRYRLSGDYFSEVSDASGTSLFDVGKRRWSDEMAEACEVPRRWLPEVTESPVVSARVSARAAKATGLLAGTPIVGGGGDQAAQAVGNGITETGLVAVTVGTSGVVFAPGKAYRRDPQGRLHAFCHAVPGMWHLMGVMLSAGGSFRWYRDHLCTEEVALARQGNRDAYDLLTEAASGVPAGAEGLLFLPYLSGERTPYPDPAARGVFFGLSLRHTKAHLTRAVLEGVSFGLLDSLALIRSSGVPVREIRVSGGGARSALWRQILADVFGKTIVTVNVTQGAAYGAALLAAVGAGIYRTVEEACRVTVAGQSSARPGPDGAVYRDYFPRYQALYRALKDEFQRVALLAEKRPATRRRPRKRMEAR